MARYHLLHGVGLDASIWTYVAGRLDDEVDAPEFPGHGQAVPAAGTVTLGSLAEEFAPEEPGHLVGFSLGALVAQRIALDRPEVVLSLTLVASVANRTAAERAAVRERLAQSLADREAAIEAAIERWSSDRFDARPVAPILRACDPDSYHACYRVFCEADAELWPELPRIAAPTVAIAGADDSGSTPAMSEALAARIPGARCVVVPGARHLLPLERPDQVAAQVRAIATG